MKFFLWVAFIHSLLAITPEEILKKVDKNLNFSSAIMNIKMEIYLPDKSVRIKKFKTWISGNNSYVEFLNKEDKHVRYLKIGKRMWIYDKEEENTFLISGHLLKQSMMGSDISYEDILETEQIYTNYDVKLIGEENLRERSCYVILLTAKVKEVNYFKRKMWIDKEQFFPLKEEIYAKNDKLLKTFEYLEIEFYKDKVYPTKSVVSDKLKIGTKTVVIIEEAIFDVEISSYYFTRRYLER